MNSDDDDLLPPERTFAREMKRRREEQGISQAELLQRLHAAGLTYLNQTALSRMENRSRQVRLIEAQAIAHALRQSIEGMMQPSPLLAAAETLVRFTERAEQVRDELDQRVLDLIDARGVVSERTDQLIRMVDAQPKEQRAETPAAVIESIKRGSKFLESVQGTMASRWIDHAAKRARGVGNG